MRQSCQSALREIKPRVFITFRRNGENGGPYISHQRIMNSELRDKYEFIPLMLPKPKELLSPKRLCGMIHLLRAEHPDILHFTGLQLEGFVVMLAAKLSDCRKTVCAIHGSSMDALEFHGWKRWLMCALENWTLRSARVCYGVSAFVAEWPRVKRYAKHCFGHIYNFPDFGQSETSRTHIREEFGIAEGEVVVVSTGRITTDKGFSIMTDAILEGREWPGVRFLIVGSGEYLPEMKRRIAEAHMERAVLFTGYRKDVGDILKTCDIFVICTFHETLCNSVIEASHHGLPVVATNTGGIPEIVQDGYSGILTEPGNAEAVNAALLKLISNRQLRVDMGLRGQKIIEDRFNNKKITESIGQLYDELLEKR